MENDPLATIKVVVGLQDIEFLSLDDVVSEQERQLLLECVGDRPSSSNSLPGAPGRPWTTPKRPSPSSTGLDFGSATEVFNSLQQQGGHVEQEPHYGGGQQQQHAGHQQQQHISLPPYMTGIPLPSCSSAQHIHINNFTANLNFPPVTCQGATLQTQPLPFTVGYPSSGPYVAPFPQPSPSPPGAGVYPGHIMVYQPPLHVSMYPPVSYPEQTKETAKEPPPNITFGSTPVVSVRHSSSEDEQEIVETNVRKPEPRPVVRQDNPPSTAKQTVIETPSGQQLNEPGAATESDSKSWASLFNPGQGNILQPPASDKPTARITPFTPTPSSSSSVSQQDKELSLYLRDYTPQHIAPAFLPRGLTNRSNWCFVNAILQALLACPPFYNLMKNLPVGPRLNQDNSSVPMLESVVEFVKEMSPLETMNKNQKKDKARKKEDLPTGHPLEPSLVYKTLLQLESETFKVVEGRQEDAEEFLTCLLNMISDEMTGLMKLTKDEEGDAAGDEEAGGGEWQEAAGARGRSMVTRRVADHNTIVTPLHQLALGMCRYSVKAANNETSATLQPFYTLQLDIQSDNITSLGDALRDNFASEQLDGYICSKTKQEVEASRSLSLEELPPILILHLKRFVYSGTSGGCQKVMKHVEFSVDLEINRDLLSNVSKSKYTAKQRQYKLFAVVYHNGREATKGHYVTDVYHTGYASWLHCDDSIVQPTAEQLVTSPQHNSTPYILFYRRGDTMVGVEKTVK